MKMTETYEATSYDEAIEVLKKLKANKEDCKITIYTFDFDKNLESHNITTPEKVCILVEKSKSIIMNRDEVVPHMQLFSIQQSPENIIRKGIMHDVLLLRTIES